MCDLAALTRTRFFYKVVAFKDDKARSAVEADLADQVRMIHGFLGWFNSLFLDRPFLQFYVKKKGVSPPLSFYF
jgi:hypothetical protein